METEGVMKGEGNGVTPPRGSRRAETRQMRSPLGEEGSLVRCVTRGQIPLRSPEREGRSPSPTHLTVDVPQLLGYGFVVGDGHPLPAFGYINEKYVSTLKVI